MFLEGLQSRQDLFIETVWLNDLDIKPCNGCFGCTGKYRCIKSDDMNEIYGKIESSDLYVFGVPIYRWFMNAQFKLYIDRLTALLSGDEKINAMVGKNLVIGMSCNFQECADCTTKMFNDFGKWVNMKWA